MTRGGAISRALATIWVLSTVAWAFGYHRGVLGYSGYSAGGVQHEAAGTAPTALVLSVVGLVFFCALLRTELLVGDSQIAPLWRRYIALLVDFWSCVFTFAALSAMIPLLLEANRTGAFQWHFERDYGVPSDGVGFALVAIGLAALVAYFVLTLANRRQTIGRWLLRIATVNADGKAVYLPLSRALWRSYSEFAELVSFSTLWKIVRGRDAYEGTYDRESGFRVVRY